MTFDEVLEQALERLGRCGRVSYRALKIQFHLDDDLLEVLKKEIVTVHQLGRDEEGTMLVWTGDTAPTAVPLYAKRGQWEQACTELGAAIELYRAMDMSFWLPQAEAALTQVEAMRYSLA